MINPTLIPINDSLKEIQFLYIENDPYLRDIDKDNLESCLGGFGAWCDLEDYKIQYLFNAFSHPDTFKEIVKADYILLSTSFTGVSGDLLYNFILGAKEQKLKNKIIINCTSRNVLSKNFDDLEELIEKLDKENNITFYFPSVSLNAFVKHTNKEGFN
jgi:hypothetical protein